MKAKITLILSMRQDLKFKIFDLKILKKGLDLETGVISGKI